MASCFDIYVISTRRNVEAIENFLNEFLPKREALASEYEFPRWAEDPEVIYNEAGEVLIVCCKKLDAEYGLYWRSTKGEKPKYAMIFFLRDGHIIFGLSTDDAYPDYAATLLTKMKKYLGSEYGYICHECPPDVSCLGEFREQIEIHRAVLLK